ncbi:MAG: hypothetical protein KIT33_04235 [Candidatus Kapabacteria bacterium]|nr:hypothetical protein [Ignavibacteriota bacterium]MCW5884164.1 hypothetical protein [Candidatus Kapabacteria bacterium]
MKSIIIAKYIFPIIIILLIINFQNIFAQGFDWQKGGRMPYQIPNLYAGISLKYSYNSHFGEFNFKENFIECCKFTEGSGSGFNLGLTTEYWYDSHTALMLDVNFSKINSEFAVRSILPTRGDDFITEYGFNSTLNMINIESGGRFRILNTHFSIGGVLRFSALVSSNSEYSEQAISQNVPFERRIIPNGSISELNSIVISPVVTFAYDAQLGTGYYATPNISLSYTLNSIIQDESLRRFGVEFGIRIMRSLKN